MRDGHGIVDTARRLMKGGRLGRSLSGKNLGKGITQRRDGLYQGSAVIDGVRKTVYDSTLTGIRRKLTDLRTETRVVKKQPTLDEWFEEWLSVYKLNIRESTKSFYRYSYKRVGDKIGSTRLTDLTYPLLQRTFNEMKTDMSRRNSKAVLHNVLEGAIRAGLIEVNPAKNINIVVSGDANKEERRVMTLPETDIFKEAIKDYTYRDELLLCLETGMRINEVLGLYDTAVDFDKGVIFVRQTLSRRKGGFAFHKPKTESGKRIIPMTKGAQEILKRRMRSGLLFTNKHGNPISANMIENQVQDICKEIAKKHPEFKPVTPHTLRHTFATRCIERGMNPKTLQKILGHSSLQMTMNLYCHVTESTMIEEMKMVDSL